MRAAQTSTVDKPAAFFEHCDIFIDTDDDAWAFIAANPKARAVVDALIDVPISWNFGRPLQKSWPGAPADWRAVDLNFRMLEQEGRLSRLPKLGYVGTDTHRYTLQVAIAAKQAGLRAVMHDDKTGWQIINLQVEHNVIDFTTAHGTITQHRARSHQRRVSGRRNTVVAVRSERQADRANGHIARATRRSAAGAGVAQGMFGDWPSKRRWGCAQKHSE